MHISRLTDEIDSKTLRVHGSICPYMTGEKDFCSASVMETTVSNDRWSHYCCTEDHDRCPLFLAKILRGGN